MTPWSVALCCYIAVAFVSLVPVIWAWMRPVALNPGGPSFDESPHFSDEAKSQLTQNFERLRGTLGFWKHEARKYEWTHIYCMIWLIILATAVPVLTIASRSYGMDDLYSTIFLTCATSQISLVTGLHKFFKVEKNFKAFRLGESEFYDTYRRLLDTPEKFGKTEKDQLANYFDTVGAIRKNVRAAETDTYAGLEEVRQNETKPPGS
jgi:hypothetical protein